MSVRTYTADRGKQLEASHALVKLYRGKILRSTDKGHLVEFVWRGRAMTGEWCERVAQRWFPRAYSEETLIGEFSVERWLIWVVEKELLEKEHGFKRVFVAVN